MTWRAAIYTRISRDEAGDGAGVARQEEDCRLLCRRKGWEVAHVLVDNDVSAYSGAARPAYQRLVDLLESGHVNAVVSWAPERLHRSPRELEDFIDLVERVRAPVETVKAGSWDMTSSNSRMVARMLGAVSRAESERVGERVRRAHQQAKAEGLWRGAIPYGMRQSDQRGFLSPDDACAGIVREMSARVLKGDALTAIAADLNAAGVASKRGKSWTHTSVMRLLASPALGGLIELDGELRPAAFAGIMEPSAWRSVQASIARRPKGEVRRAREALTLLGGVLHCAEHGVPLFGSGDGYSRLYQANSPGRCYVRIPRGPVDGLLGDLVIRRLQMDDATEILVTPLRRDPDQEAAAELRRRREELMELVADGLAPASEVRPRLEAIREQLNELETPPNHGPVDASALHDPEAAWSRWTMPQRREALRLLFDRIAVRHSTIRNGPRADLDRIKIVWRFDPGAAA